MRQIASAQDTEPIRCNHVMGSHKPSDGNLYRTEIYNPRQDTLATAADFISASKILGVLLAQVRSALAARINDVEYWPQLKLGRM